MNSEILKTVEKDFYKNRPDVKIGDTVKLHMRISEGDKERVQIFEGIVIAMSGNGASKTLTVRKVSMGVGVERIVPMHSPTLQKIEVVRRGDRVRRSKLYYMRKRIGRKAMKVRGGVSDVYLTDEEKTVDEESSALEKAATEPEIAAEEQMTEKAVDEAEIAPVTQPETESPENKD